VNAAWIVRAGLRDGGGAGEVVALAAGREIPYSAATTITTDDRGLLSVGAGGGHRLPPPVSALPAALAPQAPGGIDAVGQVAAYGPGLVGVSQHLPQFLTQFSDLTVAVSVVVSAQ